MLTDAQLKAFPDPIQQHFIKLEHDIVARISGHIGDIGKMTATDVNLLRELDRVGFSMKEIEKDIAKTLKVSRAEVFETFNKASRMEFIENARWQPFDENKRLKDLIDTMGNATFGTFENIGDSKSIGFTNMRGQYLPLQAHYHKTIDYAVIQSKLGQASFEEAAFQAVRQMADSGITHLHWESGYRQRLDSAVRRNVLGGLARLSLEQAELTAIAIDADGMEVTWHSGHRPSHNFGGMQFTMRNFREHIKPQMEEPNCYHRVFPIKIGISPPAYTREQIDELKLREEAKTAFEGKKFTLYEAIQRQRRLETAIRQQKDRLNAFEAYALDKSIVENTQIKLRMLTKSYKEFSKAVGLSPKMERTKVAS